MKKCIAFFLLSFSILIFIYAGKVNAAVNGRFGVALGTWDFNKLRCYDLDGSQIDCHTAPGYYRPEGFSDMNMTTYDGTNQQLSKSAFNLASFMVLDPLANTQNIWFHYIDMDGKSRIENPEVITSGKFNYDGTGYRSASFQQVYKRKTTIEELATGSRPDSMNIYATSGAPGQVNVRMTNEPLGYTDIMGAIRHYKLRLPKIIYEGTYPYCDGCIFKQDEYFDYLQENKDFNDGNGNWYAFYMLAETEYPISSHYLEPYEYAAVLNEYVHKIKAEFPKARFILQSPVMGGDLTRAKKYMNKLYQSNLLPQETLDAITYNAMDIFVDPPPAPDIPTTGPDGVTHKAVTDIQLQQIANTVTKNIIVSGQALWDINHKPVLLTQTGVFNYGAVTPPPGSLTFGGGRKCAWCNNNTDVWKTTEYGTARLTQLVYSKLLQTVNDSHLAAWAYWGNVRQVNWTEPLVQLTWGDLNHGIYWLSWPILCTTTTGCPTTTNQVWPTQVGMVYLKMANGCMDYRPNPPTGVDISWWPAQQSMCTIASLPGDLNKNNHVNLFDYNELVSKWNKPYTDLDYQNILSNFGK